jgi:hypothetical protein
MAGLISDQWLFGGDSPIYRRPDLYIVNDRPLLPLPRYGNTNYLDTLLAPTTDDPPIMATSAMTTTTTTALPPIAARSADGSLIAIHPRDYLNDDRDRRPPAASSSSSGGRAGLIRCYDGGVSDGSLKFTLRLPPPPPPSDGIDGIFVGVGDSPPPSSGGGGGLRKLVFASSSPAPPPYSSAGGGGVVVGPPGYLCGMIGTSTILIWDLERGVLARTLCVRVDGDDDGGGGGKGGGGEKKKKKRDGKHGDGGGALLCDISAWGDRLYALVHHLPVEEDGVGGGGGGKCRVHEYDLGRSAALVRKVRAGSASPGGGGLAIAASGVAIFAMTGGVLRAVDRGTGSRLCRADVPSCGGGGGDGGGGAAAAAAAIPALVASPDGGRVAAAAGAGRAVLFSYDGGAGGGDAPPRLRATAILSTGDDSSSVSHLDLLTRAGDGVGGGGAAAVVAFQHGPGTGGASASLFEVPADGDDAPSSSPAPLAPEATMRTDRDGVALVGAGLRHWRGGGPGGGPSVLLLFQRSADGRSRGGSAAGSGTTLPSESLPCAGLRGAVIVGASLLSDDAGGGGGRKRKAAPEGGAIALAPGDQGLEASLAADLSSSRGNHGKRTRGARRDDDDDEEEGGEEGEGEFFNDLDEEEGERGQSIADRLALLSSAMEESDEDDDDEEEGGRGLAAGRDREGSKFKQKSATSETLTTLLTQALTSNDPTQLNVALQVTDRRLVEGTVRSLQSLDAERGRDGGVATTTGYIPTLMAHLVRRMARRHSLVMPLGVWVKAILAATARSAHQVATRDDGNNAVEARMAREGREMAMKLGPLKNFLNERVECFPQLLRLEGRLALLNQQF